MLQSLISFAYLFLLISTASVSAQVAQCVPARASVLSNRRRQSPCELAQSLDQNCFPGETNYPPSGESPLTDFNSNKCDCSTVQYSLISACAFCQNVNSPSWSAWSRSCRNRDISLGSFPFDFSSLGIPSWAFIDVRVNNEFDPLLAESLKGDLTNNPPGFIPTTTSIPTSSTNNSPAFTSVKSDTTSTASMSVSSSATPSISVSQPANSPSPQTSQTSTFLSSESRSSTQSLPESSQPTSITHFESNSTAVHTTIVTTVKFQPSSSDTSIRTRRISTVMIGSIVGGSAACLLILLGGILVYRRTRRNKARTFEPVPAYFNFDQISTQTILPDYSPAGSRPDIKLEGDHLSTVVASPPPYQPTIDSQHRMSLPFPLTNTTVNYPSGVFRGLPELHEC